MHLFLIIVSACKPMIILNKIDLQKKQRVLKCMLSNSKHNVISISICAFNITKFIIKNCNADYEKLLGETRIHA